MCNKIKIPVSLGKSNFLLSCDSKQYVFSKITLNKKQEEVSTDNKYFSTLEGAMKHIYDLKVKAKEATSLEDLYRNQRQALDEIKGLYGGLTEEGLMS